MALEHGRHLFFQLAAGARNASRRICNVPLMFFRRTLILAATVVQDFLDLRGNSLIRRVLDRSIMMHRSRRRCSTDMRESFGAVEEQGEPLTSRWRNWST